MSKRPENRESIEPVNHILIEAVTPCVDCGHYPAKRVTGENCVVEADIFRDGHETIRAVVKWRRKHEKQFAEASMVLFDNDRWRGEFPLEENACYVFTIEAWTDLFVSWLGDFAKKVRASRDVSSDQLEGIAIINAVRPKAPPHDRALLDRLLRELKATEDPAAALEIVSQPQLGHIMSRIGERFDVTTLEPPLEITVDRPKARFSAWYEMFPRSQGTEPGKASTLREAERRLPEIRDLGFDVVYLPPIHPIGFTNRKGPGNMLAAGSNAPGSPWAIGSSAGGHDVVEPSLGTLSDFDQFVAVAKRLGMEVAIDFAIQCSPDHPWVKKHPDWFHHRPDGSIKYAENPPKEYQDVYPINFDTPDRQNLMEEMHRIVRFWIGHGVKIFRVDNPHTKPVKFWEWLIHRVQAEFSEVLFLAEAFTRPKVMKALAKAGFSQSYTYFTWRNTKAELTEYLTELT